MKVKLIKKDNGLNDEDYQLIKDFLKFLYSEIPLENDITIYCLPKRVGEMTTGSSIPQYGEIRVLTRNRMNRDILRTIAHEWIHEHQINGLGRKVGKNIGGRNEDEANSKSGALVKMFESRFPHKIKKIYE
jgi:hypothetical protein